jgi:alkylated DNA repair dioxygenase AlkB
VQKKLKSTKPEEMSKNLKRVASVQAKEKPPKKRKVESKTTEKPAKAPRSPTPKTVKYGQEEVKVELKDNAKLEYYPNFLTPEESSALYEHLLGSYTWTHGEYKMYGKTIPTPRLLSCVSDVDISKSYKVTPYYPFTEEVQKLKEKLEEHCGAEFTYAQMNYYRDGNDYIGFHCDSEVCGCPEF